MVLFVFFFSPSPELALFISMVVLFIIVALFCRWIVLFL